MEEISASKQRITTILADIKSSNEKLSDISSYCEENFEANPPEVTTQTKQYAADAILNAAYQAHQGAEAIMELFDAQMKELNKINITVDAISSVSLLRNIFSNLKLIFYRDFKR